MKKQEVLDILDKKLIEASKEFPNPLYLFFEMGVVLSRGMIEKLDEPKKVVVPQHVADWLEAYRNNTLGSVFAKFDNLDSNNPVKRWLWNEAREISGSATGVAQTIIAKARIFGYEIEKEQSDMNELVEQVKQWSIARGLDKTEPSKQMLKVVEEVGEVASALAKNKKDKLQDGIGDVVVTLIILAQQNNMSLEECLYMAYNEIADRTGEMVDGVFVKREDL